MVFNPKYKVIILHMDNGEVWHEETNYSTVSTIKEAREKAKSRVIRVGQFIGATHNPKGKRQIAVIYKKRAENEKSEKGDREFSHNYYHPIESYECTHLSEGLALLKFTVGNRTPDITILR